MSRILLDRELIAKCKSVGITDIPKVGEYRDKGAHWTADDINKYMKYKVDSYNRSTECPETIATRIVDGKIECFMVPNPLYGKAKI